MSAYYNEFDPFAAQWLRNLIAAGHIADGEVDDRSIVDVEPDDLRGFTQCHFFAGIGVWSHALRLAGVPDDRPLWTASLPCQPFSAAGSRKGAADERNLAEVWLRLATECRPAIAFGEQVEPAIGFGWLDAVFIRLEQSHYACGAAVFPACSVGAPHRRSRLYWVADAECGTAERHGYQLGSAAGRVQEEARQQWIRDDAGDGEPTDGVDDSHDCGREDGSSQRCSDGTLRATKCAEQFDSEGSAADGMADDDEAGCSIIGKHRLSEDCNARSRVAADRCGEPDGAGVVGDTADARLEGAAGEGIQRGSGRPATASIVEHANGGGCGQDDWGTAQRHAEDIGWETDWRSGRSHANVAPTNGFWRNAVWLNCRDGKARPTQPGTFPLAHGATQRVGRLRAYGNAIVAPQAQAFIEAVMQCRT